MSIIKREQDIVSLRQGGKFLSDILSQLKSMIKPGISTGFLDEKARILIGAYGAEPSFLGYDGFPAALCASINAEVVHCIPSNTRVLKEGDIISIDLGLKYRGVYLDAALTQPVGVVEKKALNLINATEQSLLEGIKMVAIGKRIGDISYAVQDFAEDFGFSVVKDLVGHGTGYAVHDQPQIPNFGAPGTGPKIEEGMVLAIEPMLSLGSSAIVKAEDRYGYRTKDNSVSAHFEHTVLVGVNGVEVLTRE